jgi:peptidoglycan hydrolase CwlO-like protein
MQKAIRSFGYAAVCLIALWIVTHTGNTSSTKADAAAQDVMSLDRRISTLEQRLYMIESNINQLQQRVQYAQRPPVSSTPTRDPEVDRLQSELSLLQNRLSEVECALLKLDERTLPAAARAARAKTSDPCRAQPNTPVQLSSRR